MYGLRQEADSQDPSPATQVTCIIIIIIVIIIRMSRKLWIISYLALLKRPAVTVIFTAVILSLR